MQGFDTWELICIRLVILQFIIINSNICLIGSITVAFFSVQCACFGFWNNVKAQYSHPGLDIWAHRSNCNNVNFSLLIHILKVRVSDYIFWWLTCSGWAVHPPPCSSHNHAKQMFYKITQYWLCQELKIKIMKCHYCTMGKLKKIAESGQLWEPISPQFFAENT